MLFEWPEVLSRGDLVWLRLHCDLMGPCRIESTTTLGLRRQLRSAVQRLLPSQGEEGRLRLSCLFDPPTSFDPVAVKKHQKPAPAFVIWPTTKTGQDLDTGDRFGLDVLLLGRGITLIADFLRVFEAMGPIGLRPGEGCFELTEVESRGPDGESTLIWQTSQGFGKLAPQVFSLDHYLQLRQATAETIILDFVTPARVLVNRHPLKSPRFTQLFPFMLRRTTSMLFAHCGLEPCDQPQELLAAADEVREISRNWTWTDWRAVGLGENKELLGGFTGQMTLGGAALEKLAWIILIGQLFGLGKGAPYGAGHFSAGFAEKRLAG